VTDAQKPPSETTVWPLEIRRDEGLDEIVCSAADVHLEQMDDNHWWMSIEKDGRLIHINFWSKAKIRARCEDVG
jgi:hypothetical protein